MKLIDEISLRAKIYFVTVVTLFFLLMLGAVYLGTIREIQKTEHMVNHTHEVLEEMNIIIEDALNMETGMRGYLLSGKKEFLVPYKLSNKEIHEKIKFLTTKVDDNPSQVQLIGEVKETIDTWITQNAEPFITLRDEIGSSKNMNHMGLEVGKKEGKIYFDKFRDEINLFITRKKNLLERMKKVSNRNSSVKARIERRDNIFNTIIVAQNVLASGIDMETGMRGYLLTGSQDFKEPYNTGKRQFYERTQTLKSLVSDQPEQYQLVGKIESIIRKWDDVVVKNMFIFRDEIGHSKNMDDISERIKKAHGKILMDKFRRQTGVFIDRELRLLKERKIHENKTVNDSQIIMLSIILLAIVISLILSYFLNATITLPIKSIFHGLKKFSTSELGNLKKDFHNVVELLGLTSDNVNHVAGEVNIISRKLSTLANEQAATVEETSSSMEEVSAIAIKNVDVSNESSNRADTVGNKMIALDQAMLKISESNDQISQLVNVIGEIAEKTEIIDEIVFQTKLLSFNASVEAERAGELGRGFAVVAQEVGNLAKLSGQAALEISQIVKKSTIDAQKISANNAQRVIEGMEILKEAGEGSILLKQSTMQILNASNEQSNGIQEINNSILSISTGVQHSANISESASSSSQLLINEANQLNEVINNLNKFLKSDKNKRRGDKSQGGSESQGGSNSSLEMDMVSDLKNNGSFSNSKNSDKWDAI